MTFKDIFYHPFFAVQLWILGMILLVAITNYLKINEGAQIIICTFLSVNLIALHFKYIVKHEENKKDSK